MKNKLSLNWDNTSDETWKYGASKNFRCIVAWTRDGWVGEVWRDGESNSLYNGPFSSKSFAQKACLDILWRKNDKC